MAAPLARLSALWSGLPSCSVVVLRHLQKTGGSSVVRIFEELERDLQWTVSGYWTPCWRSRQAHVAQGRLRWLRGLRRVAELSNGSAVRVRRLLLDAPPWPTRQLLHLHHPDSTQCGGLPAIVRELDRMRPFLPALPCRVVVAMVVREPWSFFVSWWYYIGARRCGDCSFLEYLRLNPNAQSHMTVGGWPRQYSDALRKRHAARDPELGAQLRQALVGVDLLGTTERLDEFVWLLCEAAGLATCPRPGVANARNGASARAVVRDVRKRSRERTAKATAPSGAGGADGADGVSAVDSMRGGLTPNASSQVHRQAVEAAGWLDRWLYREAHAVLERALVAGGEVVATARRQRLAEWRRLPSDSCSGCLTFADASAAEALLASRQAASLASRVAEAAGAADATAATGAVAAAARGSRMPVASAGTLAEASTQQQHGSSGGGDSDRGTRWRRDFLDGGGGSRESVGLLMTLHAAAELSRHSQPSSSTASSSSSASAGVNADAERCAAVRSEASRLAPRDLEALVPSPLRPVLTAGPASPPAATADGTAPVAGPKQGPRRFVALCSTKVRVAVPRGCHLD